MPEQGATDAKRLRLRPPTSRLLGVEIPRSATHARSTGCTSPIRWRADGPLDLVIVASGLGLGRIWNTRRAETFPGRYADFSRLILLDRRGTGLSDHVVEREHQNIESHMDDVRAVMDAAGSERAVLLGFESGFAVAAMFAATFPERTIALISFGSKARELWAPDYPFGRSAAEFDAELLEIERDWATPRLARSCGSPSSTPRPRTTLGDRGLRRLDAVRGWAGRRHAMGRGRSRHRSARSAPVDPRAHARAPPHGRRRDLRRARPLPRGAHPRGGAARAARRPTTCGTGARTCRPRSSAS